MINMLRKCRSFNPGDKVLARNYNGTDLWLPGEIIEVTGSVSYKVLLTEMVKYFEGTKIS